MLRRVDPIILIAAIGGLLGPTGIVWVALRFNRDDAREAVGTMREVSAELRTELARTAEERDRLRVQVEDLTGEVTALRTECGSLRREVTLLRESNENGQ